MDNSKTNDETKNSMRYHTTISMSEEDYNSWRPLKEEGYSLIGVFRMGMRTVQRERELRDLEKEPL